MELSNGKEGQQGDPGTLVKVGRGGRHVIELLVNRKDCTMRREKQSTRALTTRLVCANLNEKRMADACMVEGISKSALHSYILPHILSLLRHPCWVSGCMPVVPSASPSLVLPCACALK
eukprot:1160997-Pelagomonas_calceolata.AAC.9